MSCVALDEILRHNWGINRKSVEIQMKFSGVLFVFCFPRQSYFMQLWPELRDSSVASTSQLLELKMDTNTAQLKFRDSSVGEDI